MQAIPLCPPLPLLYSTTIGVRLTPRKPTQESGKPDAYQKYASGDLTRLFALEMCDMIEKEMIGRRKTLYTLKTEN